ncbi:hypothetical protein BS50DRAFT_637724 [Corynespora cassiicola Philippines]|uniref:Uncharacterized protein n=1 Tax=Corynespora cassiicola Philippines TaxID=1448308 RepID=A0A2T2NCP7_CORCC|nr:hypothetical protein BS50DRAFT_637724 [Corynespora cassiicola Philippines]
MVTSPAALILATESQLELMLSYLSVDLGIHWPRESLMLLIPSTLFPKATNKVDTQLSTASMNLGLGIGPKITTTLSAGVSGIGTSLSVSLDGVTSSNEVPTRETKPLLQASLDLGLGLSGSLGLLPNPTTSLDIGSAEAVLSATSDLDLDLGMSTLIPTSSSSTMLPLISVPTQSFFDINLLTSLPLGVSTIDLQPEASLRPTQSSSLGTLLSNVFSVLGLDVNKLENISFQANPASSEGMHGFLDGFFSSLRLDFGSIPLPTSDSSSEATRPVSIKPVITATADIEVGVLSQANSVTDGKLLGVSLGVDAGPILVSDSTDQPNLPTTLTRTSHETKLMVSTEALLSETGSPLIQASFQMGVGLGASPPSSYTDGITGNAIHILPSRPGFEPSAIPVALISKGANKPINEASLDLAAGVVPQSPVISTGSSYPDLLDLLSLGNEATKSTIATKITPRPLKFTGLPLGEDAINGLLNLPGTDRESTVHVTETTTAGKPLIELNVSLGLSNSFGTQEVNNLTKGQSASVSVSPPLVGASLDLEAGVGPTSSVAPITSDNDWSTLSSTSALKPSIQAPLVSVGLDIELGLGATPTIPVKTTALQLSDVSIPSDSTSVASQNKPSSTNFLPDIQAGASQRTRLPDLIDASLGLNLSSDISLPTSKPFGKLPISAFHWPSPTNIEPDMEASLDIGIGLGVNSLPSQTATSAETGVAPISRNGQTISSKSLATMNTISREGTSVEKTKQPLIGATADLVVPGRNLLAVVFQTSTWAMVWV